ncbi:adenosine deaminase family protein [Oceanisphaera arctica]|uniref:adenosine deaminase family protein n=1 Tax=Oceanisphaera arctica TaxID=641510 RepID=UPI001987E3F9|nr:hypothetical protein [Oceanisphaera arctica]GHA09703.1 adenine deaminase [Oceanisphaera arctica]
MSSRLPFTEFLHRFPKVDIHYHLLGGVRLSTMQDLARHYGVALPEAEAKSYYRAYQSANGERRGGIAALNFLYTLMRSPQDYYRVAREVAEDAHATGIRYIETFWNPSDVCMSYQAANGALIRACDDVERELGLVMRLIPSINREKSPEEAVAMVEAMIAHPHPYVLGIGIDYKEQLAPVEGFWKAYRLARAHGYRLTGHCSEFGLHWRNVETGLDLIGLDRIDHGYTVIDNPELAARCAREGVPFTVIPSNTYYLSQWPETDIWRQRHPIRKMAELGLNIVPCTDDWHMHNTNGAELYRVMVEEFGFDLDGIRQCMLNGIEASWAPETLKARWRNDWPDEFDRLRAALAAEPVIPPQRHVRYRLPRTAT